MERYVDVLFAVMMTLVALWAVGATTWAGILLWQWLSSLVGK